jgi:arginyl-tRNA synthetase
MNPITTEGASAPLETALPDDALRAFAVAVERAIAARYPDAPATSPVFEAPRRPEFGDFATNVALQLAKVAKRSPQDVALAIIEDARTASPDLATLFSSIEPVAGFINLRLAPLVWQNALRHALTQGARFGELPGNGKTISLEFGSANPTGPLVVVQGRSLSIGDALVRAMRMRGYGVFVEWIINDAGAQMDTLGRSIYARYREIDEPGFPLPENGYPGDYLVPIATAIRERDGQKWVDAPESDWLAYFAKTGRDELVAQQERTAERFGVHYDLWQSEKELHETGKIRAGIERLTELGTTYENEGALWFRATDFNDDKDRVVLRSDGRPTYFALDVTYHYEKLKRAGRVIDILGPDHHGYVGRLKGLAKALGYDPDSLDVLISGQVALMRGGETVSMSKRAGDIVTLDNILDEVGNDAARFFFAMLSPESPLTFDLKLAVEKTAENPVYYVQYGHARIASILKKAGGDDEVAAANASLEPLTHASELTLARRLAEFPRTVQGVVDHLAPHRMARYARDVASDFHGFYTECKVLDDDRATRLARLALCIATANVLSRALALLGVSAPDVM